jgi:hypothetical protein
VPQLLLALKGARAQDSIVSGHTLLIAGVQQGHATTANLDEIYTNVSGKSTIARFDAQTRCVGILEI